MKTNKNQLQQSLEDVRTRLLIMCAEVSLALENSLNSLFEGNDFLARAVITADVKINNLEMQIDEAILMLLARYQPVARDLRFVVASLRMVGELERIGDEAANIAEKTANTRTMPQEVTSAIKPLAHMAQDMYARAISALREYDAQTALSLCRSDAESTREEVLALQKIMHYFCRTGADKEDYTGMHGVLICRALNRICHRVANIAEQTWFIVHGENIKHLPLSS